LHESIEIGQNILNLVTTLDRLNKRIRTIRLPYPAFLFISYHSVKLNWKTWYLLRVLSTTHLVSGNWT